MYVDRLVLPFNARELGKYHFDDHLSLKYVSLCKTLSLNDVRIILDNINSFLLL